MRTLFGKGFRSWLEGSRAEDAVLGVVSGGDDIGDGEREHLMSRKTTDFSSDIRRRLKGLGVVRSVVGRDRVVDIMRSIDRGVPVSDLVDSIRKGLVREYVYESEPDQFAKYANVRLAMAGQDPDYVKDRRSLVRHLLSSGLSRDEAEKVADARFGPRSRSPS